MQLARRPAVLLAALTALMALVPLAVAPVTGAAAASVTPLTGDGVRADAAGKAAPAVAPANANWPTFHGNVQLTGVSHDTSVSASNAAQLGVRWMTHTFGPVLSS